MHKLNLVLFVESLLKCESMEKKVVKSSVPASAIMLHGLKEHPRWKSPTYGRGDVLSKKEDMFLSLFLIDQRWYLNIAIKWKRSWDDDFIAGSLYIIVMAISKIID